MIITTEEIMYSNIIKIANCAFDKKQGFEAYKNYAIVLVYILKKNDYGPLIHQLNNSYRAICEMSDKEKQMCNNEILILASELKNKINEFVIIGKEDFLSLLEFEN